MKSKGVRANKSDRVKRALIEAQSTIKQKFRDLHNQRKQFNYNINERYKTITRPLQKLVKEKTTAKIKKEEQEKAWKEEFKDEEKSEADSMEWDLFGKPQNPFFASAKASRNYRGKKTPRNVADNLPNLPLGVDEPATSSKGYQDISGFDYLVTSGDEGGAESLLLQEEKRATPSSTVNLPESIPEERELIKTIETYDLPPVDKPYGFQINDNGELVLGKDRVKIRGGGSNYVYHINGQDFPLTNGLTHLLLESTPNSNLVTADELNVYKKMLTHTNAHKMGFRRNGRIIREESSSKYNSIIKELFPPRTVLFTTPAPITRRRNTNVSPTENKRRGRSKSNPGRITSRRQTEVSPSQLRRDWQSSDEDVNLHLGGCIMKKPQTKYKSVIKGGDINYTYWDDPNELVDRLRILIASKSAGHTGHQNEMISIIEELREAKIIK